MTTPTPRPSLQPAIEHASWSRTFALPGNADDAWRALTDPTALRVWFTDHTEVELRTGGCFAFWGLRTPWIATREQADQRITRLDPDARTLALRWTWQQTPVNVTLAVSPDGPHSTLAVNMSCGPHRFGFKDEAPYFMADFWRFAVGNLREYLVTGHAAMRPDFHDATRGVDMTILIRAQPKTVWAALTDPSLMDQWISSAAVVEAREGGAYSYGWGTGAEGTPSSCGPTRIIEMVPGKLLVTNWRYRDEPRTCVSWELEEVPEGTLVRLRHVVPTADPTHTGYVNGWASFMVELREFVHTGERQRTA